jgi:uncharacterized protein (TIGR02266 family)
MDDAPTQGRRAHQRIRLQLEVAYRSTGSFLVSYTVNLSRGGLFVETQEPAPVGSELDLRLEVPGYSGELGLRGVVVWIQQTPEPGKPMGMGIEFRQADAGFDPVIDQLVRQFSGLRVLLSSPSARTRSQLQRMLSHALAADYQGRDPEEALAEADAERYDLAVLDLGEGHRPSLRLLESLLRTPDPSAVVVLAADPRLRRQACDLGADDALSSPAGSTELRTAALRALGRPMLRRSPEQQEEP